MVEGTAAGKYASQLLKASCASYAKGLAPHALCQVSPTKSSIHWRHGIKNVKTWIKESMSPMKQPIHWRQARYTSDRLRFFHSAGHRSWQIRQPAAQSGRRSSAQRLLCPLCADHREHFCYETALDGPASETHAADFACFQTRDCLI